MRRTRWLAMAGLLLTSCILEDDQRPQTIIEPIDPYPPPTTIATLILNFRKAYEERNYDEYAKLFTDDFVFVFNPLDETGFDSWTRGEELAAHRNLFGGEPNHDGNYVTDIRLAFEANEPDSDPMYPEYSRVILSAVELRVDTRNTENGDLTLLITPSGYQAHLYLRQTAELDPDSQLPLWKIVVWRDAGTGALRPEVAPMTWGKVKALYR